MVSRDISIDVTLDDVDPLAKFLALSQRADRLAAEQEAVRADYDAMYEALARRADEIAARELELRREIQRTAQKAAMLAMATVGFLRSVYSLAGIQLTALQEAVLLSIQQVISTAVAWFTLQAAITAGSWGVQAVGMVAAAAALGVAIGNAAMIAVYGEQIDRRMNDMVGAIVGLENIAIAFSAGDF